MNGNVLISTLHPLGSNYGGLIQAYALQRAIRGLGFCPVTNNSALQHHRLRWLARQTKRGVHAALGRQSLPPLLTTSQRRVVQRRTLDFIQSNLETVDLFGMPRTARDSFLREMQAIVVGSDQVWRNGYANVPNQLLKFAEGYDLTRISYAASFGSDRLIRYSDQLRAEASRLAGGFDAISVREDSGVQICDEEWGVRALQHVDPTLLLRRQDYESLIDESPAPLRQPDGELFVYVLDRGPRVARVVNRIQNELALAPFEVLADVPSSGRSVRRRPTDYEMRPLEEWLHAFSQAKFIVTDSFHGTVFAIIFNKPFIAIGNHHRGLARFDSLLRLFQLPSKLIDSSGDSHPLDLSTPDWDSVNRTIDFERERAYSYLRSSLRSR